MANHGTLFVADFEEAGRETLERLANFLESKKLPPDVDGKEFSLDVRFIASSSLPLDELKSRGTIPARMAAMLEPGAVRIPPLRERREDVPLLLHHFLEEANHDRKKPMKGFTPAALSLLEPYDWPGNVRELAHLVRGISSKKKQGTMIDASDIPPEIIYRQLRRKESAEQEP
jgi:DNA-binding NtrC family response regulator